MVASSVSTRALELLGEHARGSVHSVFATSLNLELGGALIHVGSAEAPLSCVGASVAAEEATSLAARADVGDPALWDGRSLLIGARAGVASVALDQAIVIDLAIRPLGRALAPRALASLRRDADALGLVGRIGLPWAGEPRSAAAMASLTELSAACRDFVAGAASEVLGEPVAGAVREAVAYLVGRGPGLTPSGDDVLCGFGTGLRFLWGPVGPAREFLDVVARAYPGRTTQVSEAYLAAMCAGHANEDYLGIVEALRADEASAMPQLLARALAVGHTSGADSLFGFMAAFGCLR